jgi:hypothetical protein
MWMRVLCLALLVSATLPREGTSCCAPRRACCEAEHGGCPLAPGGSCLLAAADAVTALPTHSPDVAPAWAPASLPSADVAIIVGRAPAPAACLRRPHGPPGHLPLRI